MLFLAGILSIFLGKVIFSIFKIWLILRLVVYNFFLSELVIYATFYFYCQS